MKARISFRYVIQEALRHLVLQKDSELPEKTAAATMLNLEAAIAAKIEMEPGLNMPWQDIVATQTFEPARILDLTSMIEAIPYFPHLYYQSIFRIELTEFQIPLETVLRITQEFEKIPPGKNSVLKGCKVYALVATDPATIVIEREFDEKEYASQENFSDFQSVVKSLFLKWYRLDRVYITLNNSGKANDIPRAKRLDSGFNEALLKFATESFV